MPATRKRRKSGGGSGGKLVAGELAGVRSQCRTILQILNFGGVISQAKVKELIKEGADLAIRAAGTNNQ